MRKVSKIGLEILVSGLIVVLLLEAALRLVPSLVPLELLAGMGGEVRSAIAARRHLETEAEKVFLERDDNGPRLPLRRAGATVTHPTTDFGAVQTVTMDEQGFCNPSENSFSREKIEIIAIGDSFTWCTTVRPEDTWTSRLGGLTQRSVYNLGASGIGVYEYLQVLKKFGLAKSPQIVVLAVYEGNDLRDVFEYDEYRRSAQEKGVANRVQDNFLVEQSYSLNLLLASARWGKGWLLGRVASKSPTGADGEGTTTNFHYTLRGVEENILFNPANADLDEPRYAARLRRGEISLELYREALVAFAALAKQNHFSPVLLYLPSAHTTYTEYVTFEDPQLHELLTWFSQEQRAFFKEESKKLNLRFIDTTEKLKPAAEGHRLPTNLLYYPTNLHLTAVGHDTVARYLTERIR